ncbi:NACHT, LRR and PYD domains-containing protein 3-like [Paramisgurnus dabryanus]|uniref:NACHT, LRR and PYD domains-containing protein 3-like n=1 Tax=Paramisgurnus dabryanus TaxID=90735 RepID=UPI003CCF3608
MDKKHILGDPVMTFDPSMNRCETQRASSPEPSCVSVKSHQSMDPPLKFSKETMTINPRQGAASSDDSCVSMKSHQSMDPPLKLSERGVTFNPNEAKNDQSPDLHHEPVDDVLQRVKDQHKTIMKNKFESLFEGIKQRENQTLLKRIYTQLYLIEGESEGVNEEHEVLHMEKNTRTQHLQDTTIYCNDIFKPLPEPEYKTEKRRERKDKIKSVLTKGIAGIGKTVSVQKFILDWAEGTANQDVDFMFVFPFRELNLIQDDRYSLHKLLLDFYPELQDLDSKIYDECKVVFIFDGLDENRMTLMFSDAEKVSEVTETSSVPVLISNLIKGDLIPSALIWITSRPAAANQIPSKHINRLTEIQGFNDDQKEEYFRKKISDEHQASRIISHVRRSRSLHIMCHIPVFCWISSTVLQNILKQDNERAEIPKTLTEMYIHFLLIQMNMKNEKYDERDPEKLLQSNREVIVKLSELAFKQLMKGNVMFYEEELRESGIDITDASVYSGICTEIFKEESGIHQRKIYCFIHLSFQEFLAAFYVLYCHIVNNKQLFLYEEDEYDYDSPEEISDSESLIRGAVNEALESKTGHLDLFLRFLLGISLESNQSLLQDLLTHTVGTIMEVTQYIKDKIKGRNDDDGDDDGDDDISAERSINLFLCLLEVNDQTLYREIEEFVRSDKHSEKKLSAAHCSAIAYMLQMSEEVLDELNLKKYNTTEEGRRRLIPAVTNCTRAIFTDWIITMESCKMLSSCLQSSNSSVRDLDLSNNDLQDSGVKLISDALKSPDCKLHTLRLSGCNLTAECCESLSSCLQSSNSSVRDLDVSNNDLQDSGVKHISETLKSPDCKLQILRLSLCNLTAECCESLSSCLQSSNSSVRDLDVSNNDLQDSGVKLISDALKSPDCKLHTLRLSGCMVTDEGCCYLASALSSNPSSHLRELDLSYNHPQHSGRQMLSQCTLDKLKYELNTSTHNEGKFRITAGLHKYACDLTLDANTAHKCLILSEDNRKVTYVKDPQPYPDHPDRFEECIQVLCRESLTGRCYWEVEFSWRARISVTYKSISRNERSSECDLGFNVKSWCLYCSDNRLIVRHDESSIDIPPPSPPCNRVGVYLDWSAGTLSFYSVSDKQRLKHLHTFNTTFTEPLYAGFRVYNFVLLC